jgi:hypothetical protein
MDFGAFIELLGTLDRSDIELIATRTDVTTVGDEVDAWHATIAVDRELRQMHRTRQAAHAAYQASQVVLFTAGRLGWELPNPVVTKVARSAAEIARAMTAGDGCAIELNFLLQPWLQFVGRVERVA